MRSGAAHRLAPLVQLQIARLRALDVDALLLCGRDAVLTKACNPAAGAESTVIRADGVAEWTLALAAPHQTIDVVRAQIVLDHAEPEVARVRIARAGERRRSSDERDFARSVESGDVRANHILEPADDFHAALVRGRENVGEDVVVAVVGRLLGEDARVAVVLTMRRGELSAVKVVVVLLLAVIGERAAAQLASADAAAVSECREEERVERSEALEVVEYPFGAFVHEGNGAGLNADHGRLGARGEPELEVGPFRESRATGKKCRRVLKKLSAVHVGPDRRMSDPRSYSPWL